MRGENDWYAIDPIFDRLLTAKEWLDEVRKFDRSNGKGILHVTTASKFVETGGVYGRENALRPPEFDQYLGYLRHDVLQPQDESVRQQVMEKLREMGTADLQPRFSGRRPELKTSAILGSPAPIDPSKSATFMASLAEEIWDQSYALRRSIGSKQRLEAARISACVSEKL